MVGVVEKRRAERSRSRSMVSADEPLHQFVLADRPAEQQELAGDLPGAATGLSAVMSRPARYLRAGPVQLLLGDALAGLLQFVDDDRDQLRQMSLWPVAA